MTVQNELQLTKNQMAFELVIILIQRFDMLFLLLMLVLKLFSG